MAVRCSAGIVVFLSTTRTSTLYPWIVFPAGTQSFRVNFVNCSKYAADNCFEFSPVRLLRDDGRVEQYDYTIAKCIVSLDCIDRNLSSTSDGTWRRRRNGAFVGMLLTKVLDRTIIAEHKAFRVQGAFTLVIREDVKDSIKRAGLTGCSFLPVDINA